MEKLFTPLRVGTMTLANRLVMPPMATSKAGADDSVTDATCEYYQQRARYSKIGLIITEHSYIHPQGKAHAGQVSIATDAAIPGFRRLTDLIHAEGVKVVAQISHAGSRAQGNELPPIGPSAVLHPRQTEVMPLEMTVEQIHEVTEYFVAAALRAKAAGFDGVEIHCAHGYLLNQFYSPLTNQRTDEYGAQSIENRTRFACEVLRAVRAAVGAEYPLFIRLGGCDYLEGGSVPEDCAAACLQFEAAGADAVDLTGGLRGFLRPGHTEPGFYQELSVPVKQAVHVPVLLTGGVTTPAQAEELLEADCADLIGVGRAIFKNPHWADEAAQ
jgi:2,4-dienoyl-CoA reductase-like NADH-dependent reductase (Old Yellow Enzyme family)